MASILERWIELFPNDRPSEKPSAVAGGIDGANTHESSLKGGSPWHEDGWSESSNYPLKGDVEMVELGNMFVRAYYRSKGNRDNDLGITLVDYGDLRKERPGPVKKKWEAKYKVMKSLGRTGEGKAIRGEYRVPDTKAISDWQNFNDEAASNSQGIQTVLL